MSTIFEAIWDQLEDANEEIARLSMENDELRAKLLAWENWFNKPYDNFTPPPIHSKGENEMEGRLDRHVQV